MDLKIVTKKSIASLDYKFQKSNEAFEEISPYVKGVDLNTLSKRMDRKIVRKQSTEKSSSFAEACKIYKANSDEFRCTKRKERKGKVSPTKVIGSTVPQTVSDMNDSEYLIRVDNNRRYKYKKRRIANISCRRQEDRKYEFYNGDRLHCPAINKDMINFNDNHLNKTLYNKKKKKVTDNTKSSDVWKMLRDMNRFQSVYSPPLSEDSIKTIKKKGKTPKAEKRTGFIETCTTEEFSYISSYDINSNSRSILSQTSFDRITIIDKTSNAQIKEATRDSISSIHNKRILVRTARKAEDVSLREPIYENTLKNCTLKNGANTALEHKNETIFKPYMSRDSFNGHSDSCKSGNTVLNNYEVSRRGPNSKDKSKKVMPKNHITVNGLSSANRYFISNVHISAASEKSRKTGLISVCNTKFSDNHQNKQFEVSSTVKSMKNCSKFNISGQQNNLRVRMIVPKLTHTEVRRRLAKLNFPLVILGREEISSNFKVSTYNFSQFDGLDQQIWPYMTEWSGNSFNNNLENVHKKSRNTSDSELLHEDDVCIISVSNSKMFNGFNKRENLKFTNHTNMRININSKKSQNQRDVNQFKNKITSLVSNKNQKRLVEQNEISREHSKEVFNCRENVLHAIRSSAYGDVLGTQFSFEKKNKADAFIKKESHPTIKHPWSKAKWKSNFVNNVMTKLKNGFYYSNDEDVTDIKNEIPTAIDIVPTDKTIAETTSESIDNIVIPGFNDTEILTPFIIDVKILKRKEILIHHYFKNAILQFDIAVPSESEKIKSLSLSSFKLVMGQDDETKLYKCNNSIPNAVLPAQLCCVMPKLICQINKLHKEDYKIERHKNRNDSQINFCQTQPQQTKALDVLSKAIFCTKSSMVSTPGVSKQNTIDFISTKLSLDTFKNILPVLKLNLTTVPFYDWIRFGMLKFDIHNVKEKIISKKPLVNSCSALIPYVPKGPANDLTSSSRILKFYDTSFQKHLFGLNLFTDIWQSTSSENHLNACDNDGFNLNGMATSFCSAPLKMDGNLTLKAITYVEHNKKEELNGQYRNNKTLHARKRLIKTLHKKHRQKLTDGATLINFTPLNRIKNMDDFCQTLLGRKQLSTVLHGYSEKRILACIKQLKSWIKCITRGQALLILLLANKNESRNLKRFRPILLQGIALNRITTAAELDMEIEVIENENICVSQSEGIFLFSTSKGFNILDELYWIAKTTAFDHQKPFDDSSKKLLKSLFERRKMSNPSYLRVMARYVGLGLLKPGRC